MCKCIPQNQEIPVNSPVPLGVSSHAPSDRRVIESDAPVLVCPVLLPPLLEKLMDWFRTGSQASSGVSATAPLHAWL